MGKAQAEVGVRAAADLVEKVVAADRVVAASRAETQNGMDVVHLAHAGRTLRNQRLEPSGQDGGVWPSMALLEQRLVNGSASRKPKNGSPQMNNESFKNAKPSAT